MSQQYSGDRLAGRPGSELRCPGAELASSGLLYCHDDHRLERLICRLPERRQGAARWLRSRSARWVRIPLGVFFILGSALFVLPVFGLWMLPVGLLLLAEDIPVLRRLRTRTLNWVERHRPHWFSERHDPVRDKEETT